MQSKATTVAAYLKELPADRQTTFRKLRTLIKQVAPGAKETMKYGMAVFQLAGNDALIDFAALASQKQYMALYVEPAVLKKYRTRLGKLSIGKCCIRFQRLEQLRLDVVSELLEELVERQCDGCGTSCQGKK